MARSPRFTVARIFVFAFLAATPGSAQSSGAAASDGPAMNVGGMVAGGALGFVGGVFLGGWAGYTLDVASGPCSCDDPGLAGALLGALVGSALLTPVLSHAVGGGRGDLAKGIGVTAVVTTGVIVAAARVDEGILVTLPLAQIWAAVAMELRTARSRVPRPAP